MKKIINVWFLVILISVVLTASVYFVSPTGNYGVGTSWATAKTTIQGAINFATSGDVIIVKYGSYTISTQITVGNKNLKIISDIGTATSWETATPDSSQCILTGSNSRIFYFDDSAITSA
ncbi:MAG: hypothetical protein Q8T08_18545, partial [Ignavibacteria bacterium]|nr:hypothetical protein [Ignavibacteria bacterium]